MSLQIFKGCLPQVLLGPFLNTLSHLWMGWLVPSNLKVSFRTLSSATLWMENFPDVQMASRISKLLWWQWSLYNVVHPDWLDYQNVFHCLVLNLNLLLQNICSPKWLNLSHQTFFTKKMAWLFSRPFCFLSYHSYSVFGNSLF